MCRGTSSEPHQLVSHNEINLHNAILPDTGFCTEGKMDSSRRVIEAVNGYSKRLKRVDPCYSANRCISPLLLCEPLPALQTNVGLCSEFGFRVLLTYPEV